MRFCILFALLLIYCSCDDISKSHLSSSQSIIDDVKSEYVQDKRLAYFDLQPSIYGDSVVVKGETTISEAHNLVIAKLKSAAIPYIDSVEILPSFELNGKYFGIVNLSVCNIRSKPKHSAELSTQALLGTPLRVYKKEGDFYFIQTPCDYLGWVDAGGLTLMNEEEYQAWMNAEKIICTKDYSFVLTEPDNSASKVSDATAGNIFRLIEIKSNYFGVQFPDGRKGYVKNEEAKPYNTWIETQSPTPYDIVSTAKEFMGRPYLWGGTSGKGMDCSGFTKTVYFLNGIQLERDASLQVRHGILVDTDTTLNNLQAGDLLFFGEKATNSSKEKISHVAIYIGDRKIIHASDLVKVESLKRGDADFAEKRLNSFIRAKRVLGSENSNGIISLKESPYYN